MPAIILPAATLFQLGIQPGKKQKICTQLPDRLPQDGSSLRISLRKDGRYHAIWTF